MNESVTTEIPEQPGEVGLVEAQDYVSTEPFTFDCGRTIPGFTLRYETYGRLNKQRDNGIFICHALSGDHHAAGIHHLSDRKQGWWNNFIGPGKALDTTRYYVVCSNCLGGCQGSTGPMTVDPGTGQPYGMSFPPVTIRDMTRADRRLLDHLGIEKMHAVIGGSMGGMRVLQFGIEFPGFVKCLLPLATTARENAQAIGFNAVGREAIMQDPGWNHGNYPPGEGPHVGLSIARMMAHITYLSDESMDRKFGRRRRAALTPQEEAQFEVETYLQYQGRSFISRFDANTYLYITRALDNFDLAASYGSLEEAFAPVTARTLSVAFTSDWLFPPEQNRRIVLALLRAGKHASYAELKTDLGHDSFLLESSELDELVRSFLAAA